MGRTAAAFRRDQKLRELYPHLDFYGLKGDRSRSRSRHRTCAQRDVLRAGSSPGGIPGASAPANVRQSAPLPGTPPDSAEHQLLEGWESVSVQDGSGRTYYANRATGEAQWNRPRRKASADVDDAKRT